MELFLGVVSEHSKMEDGYVNPEYVITILRKKDLFFL